MNRCWPLLCALTVCAAVPARGAGHVSVQETTLQIPSYPLGPEDKNPPLWNANVYPYPMQVAIGRKRETRPYRAVVLENAYLRVIVLPDLGGKLYAAHDKSNGDADFVYHNHVVKPGLVALRGAWASGGIEWNFPTRGHTVHTFSPVPYKVARHADGSASVTVGTLEWVRRMQWAVRITVYPDRSYFHNRVLLYNPTLTDQRAYFWANGAVHAWDDTQVIFPPTNHTFAGMRAAPDPWPINRGVDVSWYRNTPQPYDYFCGTPGDFVAAYHHEHDCGTVFYARGDECFGKKFWTWGTARGGKLWDELLTDRDGSYIEVQSGRMSTQGDTWLLEPHACETFGDYWYPVRNMGGLVKANAQAAVNLARRGAKLLLAVNTTGKLDGQVEVEGQGKTFFTERIALPPAGAWRKEIAAPATTGDYRLVVRDTAGRPVISYDTRPQQTPAPQLEPVFPDADKATVEELFLKGYYAFKHWQLDEAVPLWEACLRRDPGYTPALRLLAILDYQCGRYREALARLEKVLQRNDDDDAARYYRALAKIRLGIDTRTDEDLAYVSRRVGQRAVAPYVRAAHAVACGDRLAALHLLGEALAANPRDARSAVMQAALLRHAGKQAEAARRVDRLLAINPLDPLAVLERHRCGGPLDRAVLAGDPQYYLEAACAYLEMNLPADAEAVLRLADQDTAVRRHPAVDYYLGWLADRAGDRQNAATHYARGSQRPTDYVFPFRNEDFEVFAVGLRCRPDDWKLHYYLGTLLAAKQRWQEAVAELRAAVRSPDAAAVAHRNLGEIYWQKLRDPRAAAAAYEQAVAKDPGDYTHYVVLDTLYAELGEHARRLTLFGQAPAAVRADFRVVLREATYWCDQGQFARALEILAQHTFHPWEGWRAGHAVYARCLHARAEQAMRAGRWADAIADLERAKEFPENLGSGRPAAPVYVREDYKLGLCQRALGHEDLARQFFQRAVASPHSRRQGGHDSPFKEDEERCRRLAAEALRGK
jgi:tetratricopeptide (TPR) repeat protein